jgi:hypothetical protein
MEDGTSSLSRPLFDPSYLPAAGLCLLHGVSLFVPKNLNPGTTGRRTGKRLTAVQNVLGFLLVPLITPSITVVPIRHLAPLRI